MKPRTMAIGAAALVVVAGLVAILVSGDSGGSDDSAPAPSLAAVTQPAVTVPAPAAGAQTEPDDAGSTKGKKSSAPQEQSSSTALPQGPSCPPTWTKELCRAVGQALQARLGQEPRARRRPLSTDLDEGALQGHRPGRQAGAGSLP